METIASKVPNILSLKITDSAYEQHLDFSFFQSCPDLKIFHFNRVSRWTELVQSNVVQFMYLQNLVEIDLNDIPMSSNTMHTLLESLPQTLRRFRHASEASLEHFPFVVERFPKLEEFYVSCLTSRV